MKNRPKISMKHSHDAKGSGGPRSKPRNAIPKVSSKPKRKKKSNKNYSKSAKRLEFDYDPAIEPDCPSDDSEGKTPQALGVHILIGT